MSQGSPQERRITITERDIARMMEELEALEAAAQTLRQDLSLITASINELRSARSFVKMLIDGQKPEESYVIVGGGVYVKVQVQDVEKVLVNVGANYLLEMSVKDALDFIDKRIKEYEDVRSRIEARLAETLRRIEVIRQFLSTVSSLMRAEAKSETKT